MAAGTEKSRAMVIREVVRSYTYVIIWMGISIAVILFNKWLLAYSGFPFPIALTLWHMCFCSFVGVMAVRVLKVVKSHNMSSREYFKRVFPIGEQLHGRLCHGLLPHACMCKGCHSSPMTCLHEPVASNVCPQVYCTLAACGCRTQPTYTCRCPSSR